MESSLRNDSSESFTDSLSSPRTTPRIANFSFFAFDFFASRLALFSFVYKRDMIRVEYHTRRTHLVRFMCVHRLDVLNGGPVLLDGLLEFAIEKFRRHLGRVENADLWDF